MAPPKKDAFADLFQSAAGISNLSLDLPLKNLSMRDLMAANRTNSPSMNVLSPSSFGSPQVSKSPTPTNQSDFDSFSIFEQKKPVYLTLVHSGQLRNAMPTNVSPPRVHQQQSSDFSLLDDEFVDVFQPVQGEKKTNTSSQAINGHTEEAAPTPPIRPSSSSSSARATNARATNARDSILAELVDIGFSLEVSNRAIDDVGPDLQACVNHIMNNGNGSSERGNSSTPPDLGTAFQDMSTDLLRKATKLFDKSKRTVIKNINQFQAYQGKETNSDGMPAWLREQEKYKERASERKNDGGVYVDYGDDEENINKEEIQRIIQAQKQRERERQRERLENMKRESLSRSSIPTPRSEQSLPSPQPRVEKPKKLSPQNGNNPVQSRRDGDKNQNSNRININGSQPAQPGPRNEEPIDLLGLGSSSSSFAPSRAEKFKQAARTGGDYISPSRRRSPKATTLKPRISTNETLNAFQQSDYETFKTSASTSFSNGNYDEAYQAYSKCLESLPLKHELRIVIHSNLAITLIKVGNYKSAVQSCDDGIALVGENINDDWELNSKLIKYWYLRLLTRKAESLEMLENFPESLACYLELITKYNVTDKKVLDAKRRINNIVNPPKPAAKPKSTTPPLKSRSPTSSDAEAVKRIRDQHNQEKVQEERKFKLHDQVHQRIVKWSEGKEDNLRSLLMSLSEVLPSRLGFAFITDKKITINDLMLTKKVKINYMKVISSIHPDKLAKYELEEQMLCQGVFVALNKAWDSFKEQNNMV